VDLRNVCKRFHCLAESGAWTFGFVLAGRRALRGRCWACWLGWGRVEVGVPILPEPAAKRPGHSRRTLIPQASRSVRIRTCPPSTARAGIARQRAASSGLRANNFAVGKSPRKFVQAVRSFSLIASFASSGICFARHLPPAHSARSPRAAHRGPPTANRAPNRAPSHRPRAPVVHGAEARTRSPGPPRRDQHPQPGLTSSAAAPTPPSPGPAAAWFASDL